MSCVKMNDNYEYELGEMCQDTYSVASYRCEENMQTSSYYGPDTRGCDYLSSLVPANTVKSSWFSSSSSKEETVEEDDGAKSSGNFFSNQPENVKLAEEYIAVLIISGLIGAAFVIFFVRKTVIKKKAEGKLDDTPLEPKEPSKLVEGVKSGAVFVKVMALDTIAKVKTAISKDTTSEPAEQASAYVAPPEESTQSTPAPLVKDASIVSC